MVSKAQVMPLAAGDAWLNNGANLLLFGPPGGGKSHLAAGLGFALVESGWHVLFTRTTDLVQRLQIARRDPALEAAIAKLDKFHLLILDDLAYLTQDQAETSVLFELISARYQRRSLLITANQPFGEGGRIFPDQAMTVAVVDRLVHHATIFEMNVESYRCRAALERQRGPGRPPVHATIRRQHLTVAPRQKQPRRPLARRSHGGNHGDAATAGVASRLSLASHPDRRSTRRPKAAPEARRGAGRAGSSTKTTRCEQAPDLSERRIRPVTGHALRSGHSQDEAATAPPAGDRSFGDA